ncbi:DnaJ (Hsp40), subfamily B, member 12 [Goodea atripinnis]|uniref:DnaJ (Hsp40), subfamily B, member 12 n=1 Tax=Goodea atripinnis TaxID=208336 RepID=A0ABV0MXM0_9TELE
MFTPMGECVTRGGREESVQEMSAGYTQKRLTEKLKVPYYVGEQFSKEFTGVNLKNLERSVEDDYISNLRNNCWKEKQQSTASFSTRPG